MRSAVGALLLGLVSISVAGCALNDRKFGFSFPKKTFADTKRPPESDELSFKQPKRQRPSGKLAAEETGDDDSSPILKTNGIKADSSADGFGFSQSQSTSAAAKSERTRETSARSPRSKQDSSGVRADNFDQDSQDRQTAAPKMSFDSIERRTDPKNSDVEPAPIELQGLEIEDDSRNSGRSRNRQVTSRSDDDPHEFIANEPSQPLIAPPNSNPIGSLPPLPWQTELERLIARAEKDLAETKSMSDTQSSEYLRKQAQLRLLYMMAQRQEEALTAIPGVDSAQQEYWQQLVWALSNSFDSNQFPDASERAAQAVQPLNAAMKQIREQASLSIRNMAFCRKISYFGNYERFPKNEFTPGYEVLLYAEIENFLSAPTADGEFRTLLKSRIEITDSKGKIVWTKGFPPTEDLCRNPRRDYFHNYQFHMPEDLSAGSYTLKLTIIDELSHKRATNSLNFTLK